MLGLYDVVRLKADDLRFGVKHSFIGAVVDVHGNGDAFTVEFIDDDGKTIEDALLVDYHAEDLELVTAAADL